MVSVAGTGVAAATAAAASPVTPVVSSERQEQEQQSRRPTTRKSKAHGRATYRSRLSSAFVSFLDVLVADLAEIFAIAEDPFNPYPNNVHSPQDADAGEQASTSDFGWEPDAGLGGGGGGAGDDMFNWAGSSLLVVRSQASYLTRPASFEPHIVADEGIKGELLPIQMFYRPPRGHGGVAGVEAAVGNRGCPYKGGPGWRDDAEDHHDDETLSSAEWSWTAEEVDTLNPSPSQRQAQQQQVFTATQSAPKELEQRLRPPRNWIALVERGSCAFVSKVRVAQALGAMAVVVGDAPSPNWKGPSPPFRIRQDHPEPRAAASQGHDSKNASRQEQAKVEPMGSAAGDGEDEGGEKRQSFWAWVREWYQALRELFFGPAHHGKLVPPGGQDEADPGQSNRHLVKMYASGSTADILIPSTFITRPSYLDLIRLIDEIEHEQHDTAGRRRRPLPARRKKLVLEDREEGEEENDRERVGGGDDEDEAEGAQRAKGLEIILERDEMVWEWPLIDFAIFLLLLPSLMTLGTVLIHRIRLARQRAKDRAPELFVSKLPCYIWRGGGVPWEKVEGEDDEEQDGGDGVAAGKRPAAQAPTHAGEELGSATAMDGAGTSSRHGQTQLDLEAAAAEDATLPVPSSSGSHCLSTPGPQPMAHSSSENSVSVNGNGIGSSSNTRKVSSRLSKAASSTHFDFLPPGRRYFGTQECAICLDAFHDGDRVRILPCGHCFHRDEVDEWLCTIKKLCPVCKRDCTVAVPDWMVRNEAPSSSVRSSGVGDGLELGGGNELGVSVAETERGDVHSSTAVEVVSLTEALEQDLHATAHQDGRSSVPSLRPSSPSSTRPIRSASPPAGQS
ncbi:hypothetical protein V8E36_001826 [Tilletia maclaganii]